MASHRNSTDAKTPEPPGDGEITPAHLYFSRRSLMRGGALVATVAGTGWLYRRLNTRSLVPTATPAISGLVEAPAAIASASRVDVPNLHRTVTLSGELSPEEASTWAGSRGRISAALLARVVPEIARLPVYLCGPAAMMAETRAILSCG